MDNATDLRDCDVVMKGGITSGAVYPSAIRELSKTHRFRNIGGASVGAIAAAMTAAAEYGRRTGKGTGFEQFDVIDKELASEGFLVSLFPPRPEARSVYALYLGITQRAGVFRLAWTVLGQAPWAALPLLAWWATLALATWWSGERWWFVPLALVVWALIASVWIWALQRRVTVSGLVGLLLPLLWPCLLVLPWLSLRAWRDVSENGFGLVPGTSDDGNGLCDWLHRHLQAAAGLAEDTPLTFGMLLNDSDKEGNPVGIDLQMMTTNVSTARPMRVPRELDGYAFEPEDLRYVLPAVVVRWLEREGKADGSRVRFPAEDKLPVLLGFRLSLSFPLLFTAVRLTAPALETRTSEPVVHWFSDGGIASNFPVHFFDAWVPRRPTFALSFAPFPLGSDGKILPGESDIGLPPGPSEPRLPRWVDIRGMGGFVGQMLDTMQNWRDVLQSELPGFSDRVYEARLDKDAGEGGLNLAMDTQTIRRLQSRGARIGEAIGKTFDWDQHFFTRYLVAMQQLEQGLVGGEAEGTSIQKGGLLNSFNERRERFAAGDVGARDLFGRNRTWLPPAGAATWSLVESAQSWTAFGRYVSDRPRPQPVMRLVPYV